MKYLLPFMREHLSYHDSFEGISEQIFELYNHDFDRAMFSLMEEEDELTETDRNAIADMLILITLACVHRKIDIDSEILRRLHASS